MQLKFKYDHYHLIGMADYHQKSFFGQKTGILINSPSRKAPFLFIRCIHKKKDGTWEKPSKGEGRAVKLSLEEILCFLEVLKRKMEKWRGYHVFKQEKTDIYIGWEDENREVAVIRIGEYQKKLKFPNLNLLTLLMDHILKEKIEFATSGTYEERTPGEKEYSVFSERIKAKDGLHVVETTEYGARGEYYEITAAIKVESPKALLISLNSGQELWIPKNMVHNEYDLSNKDDYQQLIVDKWIIERNQVF